jgi:hypothetical protein
MCFGGGKSPKSADAFYSEMKPKFGALPSLSAEKAKRKPQEMKDVVKAERVGQKRRSLLYPTGGE